MNQIRTSALIGLGALGILFGRKMPGVKVIADAGRIARYSAQPVVCNGKECHFDYVTPEQGQPVDLVLVAVKATVLEQAIRDMKKFIGPDTIILSVLNGITSEEDIEAVYPGHCLWSVAIGMDATRVGRSLTFGDVVVRVSPKFAPAMHIDTDESNAAGLKGTVDGEILA